MVSRVFVANLRGLRDVYVFVANASANSNECPVSNVAKIELSESQWCVLPSL